MVQKMTQTDMVSIVIPTHNRLDLLKESVSSAINQTYTNIEVIILNNNSTDETKEWLDQMQINHPKIRTIHHSCNTGFVNSIKTIPKYIHGNYLLILSDDDYIDDSLIEDSMEHMKDDSVTICYSVGKIVDMSRKILCYTQPGKRSENGECFIKNYLKYKRLPIWAGVLHRVSTLKQIGWFKSNYPCIDAAAYCSCALLGKVAHNYKSYVSYRWGQQNISHEIDMQSSFDGDEEFEKILHTVKNVALQKEFIGFKLRKMMVASNYKNMNLFFKLLKKMYKKNRSATIYYLIKYTPKHIIKQIIPKKLWGKIKYWYYLIKLRLYNKEQTNVDN